MTNNNILADKTSINNTISLQDLLYKLNLILKEFYNLDLDYKQWYFAEYPIYLIYIYKNDNYIGKIYLNYHYDTTNNVINKGDHTIFTISMFIDNISRMTNTDVYKLFSRFNDILTNYNHSFTDLLTYDDVSDFIYEL
jgi:hypothetical protein